MKEYFTKLRMVRINTYIYKYMKLMHKFMYILNIFTCMHTTYMNACVYVCICMNITALKRKRDISFYGPVAII